MRYSLSSRFRGTILGAVVGEMQSTQAQMSHWSVEPHKLYGSADTQYSRLIVLCTRSLVRLGRVDSDDWRDLLSHDSVPESDRVNHIFAKAIIATLPLTLFYHENELKLRENVRQLVAWQDESGTIGDSALAIGYAITQCLTEKLNQADLIPQIIAFLGPHTQVAQHLAQAQTLLDQGATLERAVDKLTQDIQPSTPVALAFYCFLSTPENLRLSVLRAVKTGYQPQLTGAITGGLSGAHNSTADIPISWRMVLARSNVKLSASGVTTEPGILDLSDSLLAVWSGVYGQAAYLSELTPVAAIAAPRVIRSR